MDQTLKLCSGAEAVRKLQKAGWSIARQKGSHVMLTKPGYQWTLSIPQHKELGRGILRKILRQANLSMNEFNAL
jgi:predicted RNA binding protein YcfA (HicA-like mRNA interferase family)